MPKGTTFISESCWGLST